MPVVLVLGLAGAFLIGVYSIFAGMDLSSIIYDEQLSRVLGLRSFSNQTYPQKLPAVREVETGENFDIPVDYSVYQNSGNVADYKPLDITAQEISNIEIPVVGWDWANSQSNQAELDAPGSQEPISIDCVENCDLLEQIAAYDIVIINGDQYLTVIGVGKISELKAPNSWPANTVRIIWNEGNYLLAAKI
jgi:hypothetical protein